MGLTPAESRARVRLLMRRAMLARPGADRTEDSESELLRIEAALRRIEEGHYGICEQCGGAIGAQVLLITPTLAMCQACLACNDRSDDSPRPKRRPARRGRRFS